MAEKLHPKIDNGLPKESASFAGGTLVCACTSKPVKVKVKGQIAHNHVYWMDGDAVDAETKKKIPVGGLLFPGDKRPEGWDFLYFSAVIGMRSALPPATLGRARPS